MPLIPPRSAAAWLAAAIVVAAPAARAQAVAQTLAITAPQNVVSLSAEASREVPQDLLSISLAVVREGAEAAAVQTQLRQVLDSALAEARKAARPGGAVDVHTGAFTLSPRYAPKPTAGGNNISGWLGRAELVIEGSDIAAISQLAGRLNMLTVSRVAFGLSREARAKAEAEVAAQAIARFRERAEAYARHFGFGSYSLREVAVGSGDMVNPPLPAFRARPMAAGMAEEVQPVEAGKATVSVTVSGSVQLSAR
ncbi:MAG: SIMPL domain-containing protein [Burkholderiaceae bacterium]|nr:SIMPL domain-containing protein [Burkholderiaceae bacterium]